MGQSWTPKQFRPIYDLLCPSDRWHESTKSNRRVRLGQRLQHVASLHDGRDFPRRAILGELGQSRVAVSGNPAVASWGIKGLMSSQRIIADGSGIAGMSVETRIRGSSGALRTMRPSIQGSTLLRSDSLNWS